MQSAQAEAPSCGSASTVGRSPEPALALTTSFRTPSGRIVIQVEEAALMALDATGLHDHLDTYLRHSERLRALALRLACTRSTFVVRISPGDFW
jgi:hypothetical protein